MVAAAWRMVCRRCLLIELRFAMSAGSAPLHTPAQAGAFSSLESGTSSTREMWIVAAVAVTVLWLGQAAQIEADADLWGHLQFGLDTLRTGRIADVDPYAYTTTGEKWTNHEWLSEVSFGVAYRLAGPLGLLLLRDGLLALAVCFMVSLAVRRGLCPSGVVLLALGSVPVLAEFYRIRPQMFTYTFLAALLWIVDLARERGVSRLWWIVPMMAAWVNFHAGFVAGLGIFGLLWLEFAFDALRKRDRRECLTLLVIALATAAATTLNPYGIEYWKFVLFAIALPRPAIDEWRTPFAHNGVVIACYLLAAGIPAICWLCGSRKLHWGETLAFGVALLLAGRHARHLPILLIVGAAVFARHFAIIVQRSRGPAAGLAPFCLVLLSAAAICAGGAKFIRTVAAARTEGGVSIDAKFYPVAALEFVEREQIAGNLYTQFHWGEYALFRLHPGTHVFCDGRYETVYPAAVSALALDRKLDPTAWKEIVDAYPTEWILVSRDEAIGDWAAKESNFVEIYRDGTARLLVRRLPKYAKLIERFGTARATSSPLEHSVPFPG
jgi:hypothetical protein